MHTTRHTYTYMDTFHTYSLEPKSMPTLYVLFLQRMLHPIQKHTAEFQNSGYLQEIYSLNVQALVCLFLNFTITFSLLQKILLPHEKLLTSLLLTLVKQLLEKEHSLIKHVHENKYNPFLAQMHKLKLPTEILEDILKSILVQ